MRQVILAGALALGVAVPGLLAQPKPKSQGELEAVQAMVGATDLDARIAAAEALLTKYADTEFKSFALFVEADAYDRKRDFEHTIIFGERAIDANPKNYQALLLVAESVARHTKENDLDREESLAKVAKDANAAMEALKDATKPNPNLTDDQWKGIKDGFVGEAHMALGMAALVRKESDKAAKEFQIAIDSTEKPDPGAIVRLGMAYSQGGKYDEAIAQFDKVMAMQDVNPQFKQFAQAERVRAMQKKNPPKPAEGTAPATPAPPPNAPAPQSGPQKP